jgi:hypothetical protein
MRAPTIDTPRRWNTAPGSLRKSASQSPSIVLPSQAASSSYGASSATLANPANTAESPRRAQSATVSRAALVSDLPTARPTAAGIVAQSVQG